MNTLPYGKFQGKTISEVASMEWMDKGKPRSGRNYLTWLSGKLDPNDAKYGEKNKELLNSINDVLQVGRITETFKGTVTGGNDLTVVMDRLAELHKVCSKILTIIESKETKTQWDE